MNILDILKIPYKTGERDRERILSPTTTKRSPFEKILSSLIGPNPPEKRIIRQPRQQRRVLPTLTPTPRPTTRPTPIQDVLSGVAPTPEIGGMLGRNPQVKGASDIVQDAIDKAAQKFDVPRELLYDIAFAESSLSPGKVGPTEDVGLFQFIPGTWAKDLANYAGMQGSSLEEFDPDLKARFDPHKNAMAAAYLIKFGQLGRWGASKGNWGQHWSEEELEPYYTQTP